MAIDITHVRKETPATATTTHLNNAGAALPPRAVVTAMRNYLDIESALGGYEAAALLHSEIRQFYTVCAQLIGAEDHQIAFTNSATDSYNRALLSIPFERGDVILTTPFDYVSNQIAFLQLTQRLGVRVIRAAATPSGAVDPQQMAALMEQHPVRLVAVTHVPTNRGLVQDIGAVGQLCRERELPFLVDACQSAGQLPIDVQSINCDFLTVTFRKFLRGPRGAGFLYVSDRVIERGWAPLPLDLHSARWTADDQFEAVPTALRFELWERNYSTVLGAIAAVQYALDQGFDAIQARILRLTELLRTQLQDVAGLEVQEKGPIRCGILTFTATGVEADALQRALRQRRVHGSIAYGEYDPINFGAMDIPWVFRFSPHYYNTERDLERAVFVLKQVLEELRK